MKTSEFIKQVEELGYVTDKDNWYVYVRNKRFTVAMVSETRVNAIDANYSYADVPNKLFDLIVEYAKTPLEEREEEKKYYIRPKGMDFGVEFAMLYQTNTKKWGSHYKKSVWHTDKEQTQFTLKELEDLGIDIEHYDLEEIE